MLLLSFRFATEYCRSGNLASFLHGSPSTSAIKIKSEAPPRQPSSLWSSFGGVSFPATALGRMSASRRAPVLHKKNSRERNKQTGQPSWETRLRLLRDTADGMAYLHTVGCIHRYVHIHLWFSCRVEIWIFHPEFVRDGMCAFFQFLTFDCWVRPPEICTYIMICFNARVRKTNILTQFCTIVCHQSRFYSS